MKKRTKKTGAKRTHSNRTIVYGDYKDVLENLLRAVVQQYETDKVQAGVVISFLKTGEWYCSIKRYRTPNDSYVVISQKAPTLALAIYNLATEWSKNRSALDNLALALGRSDTSHYSDELE